MNQLFDTDLVGNSIASLSHGKAAGLDDLTAEHLFYCHPILSCILAKLFNLMLLCRYVPPEFGQSYIVPLPKIKDCRSTAMTCNDFRGIAISTILSKTFEHCILERFKNYFSTSDNQFAFQKTSVATMQYTQFKGSSTDVTKLAALLISVPSICQRPLIKLITMFC